MTRTKFFLFFSLLFINPAESIYAQKVLGLTAAELIEAYGLPTQSKESTDESDEIQMTFQQLVNGIRLKVTFDGMEKNSKCKQATLMGITQNIMLKQIFQDNAEGATWVTPLESPVSKQNPFFGKYVEWQRSDGATAMAIEEITKEEPALTIVFTSPLNSKTNSNLLKSSSTDTDDVDLTKIREGFNIQLNRFIDRVIKSCSTSDCPDNISDIMNTFKNNLLLPSFIENKLHEDLRTLLIRHRNKVKFLNQRKPRIQSIEKELARMEKALRVEFLVGLYTVQLAIGPERIYGIFKENDAEYRITLMDPNSANTTVSEGRLKWDAKTAMWKGNLDSQFSDDPSGKKRFGDIELMAFGPEKLVGKQTWHSWDTSGRTLRKILVKSKWFWYKNF